MLIKINDEKNCAVMRLNGDWWSSIFHHFFFQLQRVHYTHDVSKRAVFMLVKYKIEQNRNWNVFYLHIIFYYTFNMFSSLHIDYYFTLMILIIILCLAQNKINEIWLISCENQRITFIFASIALGMVINNYNELLMKFISSLRLNTCPWLCEELNPWWDRMDDLKINVINSFPMLINIHNSPFDGISSTAGSGDVWASMTWRMSSATFWLIRMMSISSRLTYLLKQSSISLTAVSGSVMRSSWKNYIFSFKAFTYSYRLPWSLHDDSC